MFQALHMFELGENLFYTWHHHLFGNITIQNLNTVACIIFQITQMQTQTLQFFVHIAHIGCQFGPILIAQRIQIFLSHFL